MCWVIVGLVSVWAALAAFLLAAWHRINTGPRQWRWVALLLVLVLALVHQLLFNTLADDAFVTFRYADNVADGTGPVFNAGERVEGYSDFSWLVLLGFAKTLFGVGVDNAAVVLGTLATLGSALLAYALVNRLVREARPEAGNAPGMGVLAAALTAGGSTLAVFGMSGLPTSLFLLLVLAVCYALAARHTVVAGGLLALTMMTRPDGLVIAVVAVGWLTFNAFRGRTDWWSPGTCTLGALVLLVPWTAWRLTYYGQLVPKALADRSAGSSDEMWRSLSGFLLAHHGVLLLVIAVLSVLTLRRQGEVGTRGARAVVWLVLASTVLYIAAIPLSSDEMPVWRLLAPVPPLLAVAACAAYGVVGAPSHIVSPRKTPSLNTRQRVVPAVGMVLCGSSILVSALQPGMLAPARDGQRTATQAGEIGSWLSRTLPSGTVVRSHGQGALAYQAGPSLIVGGMLSSYRDPQPAAHDVALVSNTRRPEIVVATSGGYADSQRCGITSDYTASYHVATFRKTGTSKWVTLYAVAPRAGQLAHTLNKDPGFEYVPCGT